MSSAGTSIVHRRAVATFEEWRAAARPLLMAGIDAAAVEWVDPFVHAPPAAAVDPGVPRGQPVSVPASLMKLLETIAHFRTQGRWTLMYRLASRCLQENPRLLEDAADPDVARATAMERAVRRDCHKMHAFVRFRELPDASGAPHYFAWFEPEHDIVRYTASFFTGRFANMNWTIATPDGAAVWENHELRFIDGPREAGSASADSHEELWRTYYRSICNSARINPAAMQREMPQRYWKNLPEAAEIGTLLRDGAAAFAVRHRESNEAGNLMPKAVRKSLGDLPPDTGGPQACRRCDLWQHATQAVLGAGPVTARVLLVGEQPGDQEDLRGHPFVGPAGQVLDDAITAAGMTREQLFVTNAVKHFKWEPRGKRRLHKKPGVGEIDACNIWLEQEIGNVKPRVIVALGATALRSLTGKTLSIDGARRSELKHAGGMPILATYHPSAILRAEDRAAELRALLVADLRRAHEWSSGD